MKSVLALLDGSEESGRLKEIIGKDFDLTVITSLDKLQNDLILKTDMIILDQDAVDKPVSPLIKKILKKFYLPILILTSYDNVTAAIFAVREGAYNYLIKVGDYYQTINLVINDSISKFTEQLQMNQTIIALKKRVGELEEQLNVTEKKDEITTQPVESTSNAIIEDIIASIKRGEINLPSLPRISIKFRELLNREADFLEISDLLKQDIAISSKLISVSNSAYYRGIAQNKTLEQAIGRLGLNVTKQYVDVICNRSLYTTSNKKYVRVMEKLWEHALSCAFASQFVDQSRRLDLVDDAFTMGLLHDIGKLLLLQIVFEMEISGKFRDKLNMVELIDTLGVYHGKFGASLLKRWGFSEEFAKVALYHDNLSEADYISKELLLVHFANLLAKSMGYDMQYSEVDIEAAESTRLLGLKEPLISEVKEKVKGFMEGDIRQYLV
ncbi:MAG: HDOD domain-containing protein [Deltaproteobacteria bacterium]|nr:HDOD domain-containing protein [Deltaproteobacteria bacterium]